MKNKPILENISLAIIILIGLFFRIANLEQFVVGGQDPWHNIIRTFTVIYNNLNPGYFIHPSLYYYIQAAVYYLYYLVTKLLSNNLSLLELFLVNEANFILLSRLLSVVFGTASILLVYKIGKTFWNSTTGLIAALCFSLLPLHTSCSKQIRVDSVFIFFLLLTVYWILKIYENKSYWNVVASSSPSVIARSETTKQSQSIKNYIAAAVTLGLCMSANYNGALLYLPFFIALGQNLKEKTKKPKQASCLFNKLDEGAELYIYLAIIISVGVFLLTSPYIVLDFETFRGYFKFQSGLSFIYHPFSEDRKWFYYFHLLFQQSAIFLIFGIFVIVYLLFKGEAKDRFVLLFPIIYFIIFTIVKSKYDRFVLPVLPFLCLAIGIMWKKVRKKTHKVVFIFILLIMAGQLFRTDLTDLIDSSKVFSRQNTRKTLFNFLYKKIHPKSVVFIESDIIPLLHIIFVNDEKWMNNFEKNLKRTFLKIHPNFRHKIITGFFVEKTSGYSLNLIKNKKINYVIVSSQNVDYIHRYKKRYPKIDNFYASLEQYGKLIYKATEYRTKDYKVVFRIYKIK